MTDIMLLVSGRRIWHFDAMKPLMLSFLFMCVAQSALAVEKPMTAAEFAAYTTGKTLFYGIEGREYGAEEYLPGQKVRWSFLDGKCLNGNWYEQGDLICFVYEDPLLPQCWSFFSQPGGLVAQFESDPPQQELYETRQSDAPLMCLGPEIGV